MTSTPPPTAPATSQPPANTTPTTAPNSTTAASASTPAPQSTHKRRPYEDPTDGERYQLYVHSRSHPELKQKDLVTWFADSFGKEINQSTVSRALKRYRDNPPENPEVAGSAKSKRGGGVSNTAAGSPAPIANKRRKIGPGQTAAAGSVAPGTEVEEEAASEQVQRENQQGRSVGANGTSKGDEGTGPPMHVLPFQHPQAAAHRGRGGAAATHHHHALPPQQLQHVLPHPPMQQQGAPQAPMAGSFHPPPPQHPHLSNHVHHQVVPYAAPGAPGPHNIDIDSDSDSDVEGGNAITNGNGTYNADEGSGFSSDDAELTSLHRRYEAILLRSVLAAGGVQALNIPPEMAQLGENASTEGPAPEGENGTAGNHPTLSRESLVMYVVGRNELVRSLQGRVTQLERESARLRKKVARRDDILRQLKGGQA